MKPLSFRARLLAPTLLLSAVSMVAAATIGSVLVMRGLTARFEEQAQRTIEFVAKIGAPYITNYDLTALGTFIRELSRDEQVAYAEFFDADGKSLADEPPQRPADERSLMMIEEEIKDASGRTVGRLKAGFRNDAVTATRNLVLGTLGGGMFAVLLVVSALLLWATRHVMRVIGGEPHATVGVADSIAGGDLTLDVRTQEGDEGSLLAALVRMQEQLRGIVANIRASSSLIQIGSTEISSGNLDLSQRTEQQAGALEAILASMRQMTETVALNARNADKANEVAAQASEVALQGGAVVKEAVSTMTGVTDAFKKIADITGVIDGIAFQTNILALNAAVEAARAGEQGRGFAVVAAEVRNLARRSAEAAKEIKELIANSDAKVNEGARHVNEAGHTMEGIVAKVKEVTGWIAEIAAACRDQEQGIEQVSTTMTQLEKVTQQNAAMVEQASAAASSLEEQSRVLASAVSVFRLNEPVMPGAQSLPVLTEPAIRDGEPRRLAA